MYVCMHKLRQNVWQQVSGLRPDPLGSPQERREERRRIDGGWEVASSLDPQDLWQIAATVRRCRWMGLCYRECPYLYERDIKHVFGFCVEYFSKRTKQSIVKDVTSFKALLHMPQWLSLSDTVGYKYQNNTVLIVCVVTGHSLHCCCD